MKFVIWDRLLSLKIVDCWILNIVFNMFKIIGFYIYICIGIKWYNFMIFMIIVKLIRIFWKYLIKYLIMIIYYIYMLYLCMYEYILGVKDFLK